MAEARKNAYLVPTRREEAELRDKGSRFLALIEPVQDEAAAGRRLTRIERLHPDATHHCWAWRIGNPAQERFSDAGEPAGTAGVPILMALRGGRVSDVLLVVVRWFGGTKLGRGGLVRAYGEAAQRAVQRAGRLERAAVTRLELEVPYDRLGAVRGLLEPPAVQLVASTYDDTARLVLQVRLDRLAALRERLAELQIESRAKEGPSDHGP